MLLTLAVHCCWTFGISRLAGGLWSIGVYALAHLPLPLRRRLGRPGTNRNWFCFALTSSLPAWYSQPHIQHFESHLPWKHGSSPAILMISMLPSLPTVGFLVSHWKVCFPFWNDARSGQKLAHSGVFIRKQINTAWSASWINICLPAAAAFVAAPNNSWGLNARNFQLRVNYSGLLNFAHPVRKPMVEMESPALWKVQLGLVTLGCLDSHVQCFFLWYKMKIHFTVK